MSLDCILFKINPRVRIYKGKMQNKKLMYTIITPERCVYVKCFLHNFPFHMHSTSATIKVLTDTKKSAPTPTFLASMNSTFLFSLQS